MPLGLAFFFHLMYKIHFFIVCLPHFKRQSRSYCERTVVDTKTLMTETVTAPSKNKIPLQLFKKFPPQLFVKI